MPWAERDQHAIRAEAALPHPKADVFRVAFQRFLPPSIVARSKRPKPLTKPAACKRPARLTNKSQLWEILLIKPHSIVYSQMVTHQHIYICWNSKHSKLMNAVVCNTYTRMLTQQSQQMSTTSSRTSCNLNCLDIISSKDRSCHADTICTTHRSNKGTIRPYCTKSYFASMPNVEQGKFSSPESLQSQSHQVCAKA